MKKHFIELGRLYQCCVPLLEGCAQTPETLEINFVNGKMLVNFFFCIFEKHHRSICKLSKL